MTPNDLAGVLADMKKRHAELNESLSDPKIYADRFRCRTLSREKGHLEDFFQLYDEWDRAVRELAENHKLLQTEQDEALRQLIAADMEELSGKIAAAEKQLGAMLLPPDPNDDFVDNQKVNVIAGDPSQGTWRFDEHVDNSKWDFYMKYGYFNYDYMPRYALLREQFQYDLGEAAYSLPQNDPLY